MNQQPERDAQRDAQRDRNNREELVARMANAIAADGRIEPFQGVFLARASHPMEPVFGVVQPSFCVIAQGRKEMRLGEKSYFYDAHNFLLACLELPVSLQVLEACPQRPYLGLRLDLDAALVGSVLTDLGQTPSRCGDPHALDISPMNAALLDATVRLVRLIDSPNDARWLLPLVKREIVYWLLVGPQGDRLRRMTLLGGHTHRISIASHRRSRKSAANTPNRCVSKRWRAALE